MSHEYLIKKQLKDENDIISHQPIPVKNFKLNATLLHRFVNENINSGIPQTYQCLLPKRRKVFITLNTNLSVGERKSKKIVVVVEG